MGIKKEMLDNGMIQIYVSKKTKINRLIKMIEEMVKKNLTIVFMIDMPAADFQTLVGDYFADQRELLEQLDSPLLPDTTTAMHQMIGRICLDYYIPKVYFIKSSAEMLVYEIRPEDIQK